MDDDPLILLAVGGMLKRLKCDICTADNGGAAVEEAVGRNKTGGNEAKKVDLIVMDANMPIMSGYDAASNIVGQLREGRLMPLDIVCLSAQESALHEELCKSSGMEYISIERE
ncbi:MAG: response regulator [Acidobacteriaceae bacterium]|nr:response regulator [Acidobacteriaceae bacterium]